MVFKRKIVVIAALVLLCLQYNSKAQIRMDEVIIDSHIVNEKLGFVMPANSKWSSDRKDLLIVYRFSNGSYLKNYNYILKSDQKSKALNEILESLRKQYLSNGAKVLKSMHQVDSANFIRKIADYKIEYYALKDYISKDDVIEINGIFQKLDTILVDQKITHPLSADYIKVLESDPYFYYGQRAGISIENVTSTIISSFYNDPKPKITAIFYKNEEALLQNYLLIANLFADNIPRLFFSNYKPKQSINGKFDSISVRTFLNQDFVLQNEFIKAPREGVLVPGSETELNILISPKYKNIRPKFRVVPENLSDEEADKIGWQSVDIDNVARLKGLKKGRYLFSCKYDPDRVDNYLLYTIEVAPRWFETLFFKIMVCALIAIVAVLWYIRWLKQQQKKQLYLAEQHRIMEEVKLSNIRSQLNPHFIFNALNSIQALIIKGKNENAVQYLQDFSSLLSKPLDEAAMQVWSLKDEFQFLQVYTSIENLRKPFAFVLQHDIADLDIIKFPPMLLQPIVENAVVHGLTHSVPQVIVALFNTNDIVTITVSDNGTFCDTGKVGKGKTITNNYIKWLNENTEMEININYAFDNGTKVIITFKHLID